MPGIRRGDGKKDVPVWQGCSGGCLQGDSRPPAGAGSPLQRRPVYQDGLLMYRNPPIFRHDGSTGMPLSGACKRLPD
ncbi:MAG TPA: hypothetical protein ENN44_05670 [Methanoculleus sp.]|nr:hypothetical protein [Methanoculleus sp.]